MVSTYVETQFSIQVHRVCYCALKIHTLAQYAANKFYFLLNILITKCFAKYIVKCLPTPVLHTLTYMQLNEFGTICGFHQKQHGLLKQSRSSIHWFLCVILYFTQKCSGYSHLDSDRRQQQLTQSKSPRHDTTINSHTPVSWVMISHIHVDN